MLNFILTLSGVLLGLNSGEALTPTVVFDLNEHKGYILSQTGSIEDTFPILSGQKRVVHYIGRTYYAETPIKYWTAKKVEKKGDRVTFGDSGRFLRLYDEGSRTAYGIHPYKYFEKELDRGNKYVSMGCILVSEEDMDTITSLLEDNDKIKVITTDIPEKYVKGIPVRKLIAKLIPNVLK